jgi:DNA-binding transcriptional LysR family regulator
MPAVDVSALAAQAIQQLEAQLGRRLFSRTTRRVALPTRPLTRPHTHMHR